MWHLEWRIIPTPSPGGGLSGAKADERAGRGDAVGATSALEKYQQLFKRHAPSFIRHILASFRQHALTAAQAAEQLGLSSSRFYVLSSAYLRACAAKQEALWCPGLSGGDHATVWPAPVTELLKKTPGLLPALPLQLRRL